MIPDYDHIQRESQAYNARLERLYLPEEEARPSLMQRILSGIRAGISKRSTKPDLSREQHYVQTSASSQKMTVP